MDGHARLARKVKRDKMATNAQRIKNVPVAARPRIGQLTALVLAAKIWIVIGLPLSDLQDLRERKMQAAHRQVHAQRLHLGGRDFLRLL